MPACDDFSEMLSLYVDNAIEDDGLRAQTEAHLAACPACREAADAFSALKEMLAELPDVEPPDGFHEAMMAGVRKSAADGTVLPLTGKRKSIFTNINWRGYASAAAGIVLAVVGLGAVSSFSREALMANNTDGVPSIQRDITPLDAAENNMDIDSARAVGMDAGEILMIDASSPPVLAAILSSESIHKDAVTYASVPVENTVKQYSITVTVKDFDEASRLIKDSTGVLLDSYVYYNEETGWRGAYRDGRFTKSIPAAEFDGVLSWLRGLGEVTSEDQSQYAVTYGISDAQARLKAKQVEYDRLMALLEKTTDVKSMLQVDARLQTVIREMESYQGALKVYQNNVSESIISISLQEEAPVVVVTIEPETFMARLANAFTGSVNGTVNFLEWSLVSFTGAFLPLVLLSAALCIPIFIIRKRKGRRQG